MERTMPNFLIIGAPKCGTTSMFRYLTEHPDVYMPSQKSTNFFAWENSAPSYTGPGDARRENNKTITSLNEFQSVFVPGRGKKARGEACPIYFDLAEKSALSIQKHIPEAKIICMLRSPVETAFSRYCHLLRDGDESILDFETALLAEKKRREANYSTLWYYRTQGFFSQKLRVFFDLFDRSQIKIILYDDFCKDSLKTVQDLYSFLGISSEFVPDTQNSYNVSRSVGIQTPRYPVLNDLIYRSSRTKSMIAKMLPRTFKASIKRIMTSKVNTKPVMPEKTRRRLLNEYREDILIVQDMIERDLTDWLK